MKKSPLHFHPFALAEKHKQLPFFKHPALKAFSEEQRKNLQGEIQSLYEDCKGAADILKDHPSNEDVKESLESIKAHLERINDALGDGLYFQQMLVENATEREANTALRFPAYLRTMIDLTGRALDQKAYQQKPTKAALPAGVAWKVSEILDRYNIEATLTKTGIWAKLTEHVLVAAGLETSGSSIVNSLRVIPRCKNTEK